MAGKSLLEGFEASFNTRSTASPERDKNARERSLLQQLEEGTIPEKFQALDNLGPRRNLSASALMKLMGIRDKLKEETGMEAVVAYIERSHHNNK